MKSIKVLGKSIPLAGILMMAILIGSVGATFAVLFTLSRPATVSIIATSTVFQLWRVRESPGVYSSAVLSFSFPDIYEGGTGVSQGGTVFLYTPALTGTEEIKYKWSVTGLPVGATMTAESTASDDGLTGWASLASGTLSASFTATDKAQAIRFRIDAPTTAVGTYNTIAILLEVSKGP